MSPESYAPSSVALSNSLASHSGVSEWPRITIVTPSFNQAQFLEETICSVLEQEYPNLEYMVIDGGSTDGSVAIIQKYATRLAYSVSESDHGQAHAINKGFARATGSLVGWINSDDLLLPGALRQLAEAHRQQSEALLFGNVIHFLNHEHVGWLIRQNNVTLENMVAYWRMRGWAWNQPGTFVPHRLLQKVGMLDESLRYVFDRDWMCRLLLASPSRLYLRKPVAAFRLHSNSKTVREGLLWDQEQLNVTRRYASVLSQTENRDLVALVELIKAVMFVSVFFIDSWDSRAAARSLLRAIHLSPYLLFYRDFWRVGFRVFWPLPLVRWVRARWMAKLAVIPIPSEKVSF